MLSEKFLIIKLGGIGDTISLLPVILNLRANFKNSYIEIIGYPERFSLAIGKQTANKCIHPDSIGIFQIFDEEISLASHLAKYLQGFDMIFVFSNDENGFLKKNLTNLRIKKFIIHQPFVPENSKTNIVEHLLKPLKEIGLKIFHTVPQIFLSDKELKFAEDFLKKTYQKNEKLIGIHPGSGSRIKRWPLENFVQLISLLNSRGFKPLVIIGPAEKDILDMLNRSNVNFTVLNPLPLRKISAIIKKFDVYIGNDSGISHISAAVGTPTIILYGPTDPKIWASPAENVKILEKNLGCRGECANKCQESPFCLKLISPNDVIEAILPHI